MVPLGLNINGLARDLRVPVTRMSEIVSGKNERRRRAPLGRPPTNATTSENLTAETQEQGLTARRR
jgi:hypothetical protein